MNHKIKRIMLKDIATTDLRAINRPNGGGNAAGSQTDDEPDYPVLPVILTRENAPVSGYGPSTPEATFYFSASDADMQRVNAWFSGNYNNATPPASDALIRNISSAMQGMLNNLVANIAKANLIASQTRIGWQYRLKDGSVIRVAEPEMVMQGSHAPVVEIESVHFYDSGIFSDVKIHTSPARILINIPPVSLDEKIIKNVDSIEFFITKPAESFYSKFEANGVRDYDLPLDETGNFRRIKIWDYEHISAAEMDAVARLDTDFRIVRTIPLSQAVNGISCLELFDEIGNLSNFSDLPKASTSKPKQLATNPDATLGSSSQESSVIGAYEKNDDIPWRPFVHFVTEPLHLDMPEQRKRVRGVSLRGIFQRDQVTMTLYGSHHRERWQLLAQTKSPHIVGLRAGPFRWYKLEIAATLRQSDFFDALTFQLSPPFY